ncbi:macrosialin [Anolis sagrei]|uniref:macrosialin n=1 Tax=Anolis sagrei TaxID=38937 RepID=UPI0035227F02
MEAPQKAPWALLCLAGWVLLAAGCASATGNGSLCSDNVDSEGPGCPHRKKAATLLPSFTETTSTTTMPTTPTTHHNMTNHTTTTRPPTPAPPTPTHHTTVNASHHTTLHSHSTARPQKHTTPHHHRRHTTTTHHKRHTTTDPHPHPTTSTHHTTTRHHNGTTSHRPRPTPSPHHTTTRHHNLTTAHHHNFTTTHPPHHNTTAHPHNHTTAHFHNHTTAHPHNHTTAHFHNHTTGHPLPTTGNSPTHHTTAVLTTPAHHTSPPPPVPPTVMPFVLVGDYRVENASEVCLRAQMGLQLRVRYTKKGKEQAWGEFSLQPNRTHVNGTCLNKTTTLTLSFPEGFVSFFFSKNETQNTFYLSRVQAKLTYQFPQAAESSFGADNASLHEFQAHLGHSYQCRNRSLVLKEGFQLNVLRQRIQAFGLPKGEFGEAEVCPEQRRSSALPIVVGVVLGLLILIVVVAFLFGRYRKRPGYQTL